MDCAVKTYYQHTGFIHLKYDDVHKLVEIYKDNYSQCLIGDNLVNCHVGFSMDCAVSEIYCIER